MTTVSLGAQIGAYVSEKAKQVGEYVKEEAKTKVKNAKTFIKNNTTFGRMYAFNESFGTAYVNAGKNSYAEAKTLVKNSPKTGVPGLAAGFVAGLKGEKVEDKPVPVESSVPRLEYDM